MGNDLAKTGGQTQETFIAGRSKRPFSKAAGSSATEAYPLRYVAGKRATENDAGGLFQRPAKSDDWKA